MPTTPLVITYIDPDGEEWNLSDISMANGYACAGIAGIEGVPVQMQTTPLLDGTAYTNFYIPQPGSIVLAVAISRPSSQPGPDDENNYYNLLDKVVHAFYHRRNMAPASGQITIQRPDGTVRQIEVYTTSGINTPEVGVHNTLYTFTLQTPDPFWYNTDVQQLLFSISNATGILPLLPIRFASGSVIGSANVLNTGGESTYPVWTITGPGTPTLTNNTTGRSFALSAPISAGHIVQIVTQPGKQSVVDTTTGTNIWDSLVISSPRDLWPLVPGNNSINIGMSGSTLATTIGLSWRNRWLRA
jgi:Phage tail protein